MEKKKSSPCSVARYGPVLMEEGGSRRLLAKRIYYQFTYFGLADTPSQNSGNGISFKLKWSLIVPAECQAWDSLYLQASFHSREGSKVACKCFDPTDLGTEGTCRAISIGASLVWVKTRHCCFPSFNCLWAYWVKLRGSESVHYQQLIEHTNLFLYNTLRSNYFFF